MYSKIILISFLICISACSQTRKASNFECANFHNGIISKYKPLKQPEITGYINHIYQRLQTHLEAEQKELLKENLTILISNKSLAFTTECGDIYLSTRLILRSANEARLAFILAHEMAHVVLEHSLSELYTTDAELHEIEQDLEYEADRRAVGIMASAGYHPYESIPALQQHYTSNIYSSTSHPDLPARIDRIEELLEYSGWMPPGTVNRRGFKKLQAELAAR